jgi:hypothetical protein
MKNDLAGLLKLTHPSAKGPSGVALLYRFAGLYRIARQREDRHDYAQALTAYRDLFREIGTALKRGLTDPITADVTRLAAETSNYLIEAATRAYESERENTERIFDLAVELSSDGFPPLRHLRRIMNEIVVSARHTRRDRDWKRMIGLRLRGVATIRREVTRMLDPSVDLLNSISSVERALRAL